MQIKVSQTHSAPGAGNCAMTSLQEIKELIFNYLVSDEAF